MNNIIHRHVENSGKIDLRDIDWAAAAAVGLTESERFALMYFADVERQTIVYLRSFLGLPFALEPEITAFLSTWSYEEYCHGYALTRLLDACGYPQEEDRVRQVRATANLNETIEFVFSPIVSRIFSKEFASVYTTFGALQEYTTLKGYERIQAMTENPALRQICSRIAKQERKHFAWYLNTSKRRLAQSQRARRLTRFVLQNFWVPVGAGIKTPAEVYRLYQYLFPEETGPDALRDIDEQVSSLPGLSGLQLMQTYFARASRRLDPQFSSTAA